MYKTAVEWWQLTQSQEEGHYGQTQFGHHCNSLSGSYIFPTNTTNTKGNFQYKLNEKYGFNIDHPFIDFTSTWFSKLDDDQFPQF